jgi:DNA-binding transcriptional ArsR family regulator
MSKPNSSSPTLPLPELDRLVHEPARLAILAVLASCEEADFLFLERATRLSRGNLSVQLTRLEEARLIDIEKRIEQKRTLTTARLTDHGQRALNAYWQDMAALQAAAQSKPAAASKPAAPRPGRLRPAEA